MLTNPAFDYINPGVGQSARLFSLYVPLHTLNPPYSIEKESLQEGFGAVEKDNDNDNESEFEKMDEKNSVIEEKKDSFQNLEDRNNLPQKRKMDDSIFESFMHPKVKVGKLILNKKSSKNLTTKNQTNLPLSTKKQKEGHKFNVI